jgi:hypothetical protein
LEHKMARIVLLLCVMIFLPLPGLCGTITWSSAPTNRSVREMDFLRLSVRASDSAGHQLTYTWSIPAETDGSGGKAYFIHRVGGVAEVGFPWISSQAAGQLNGAIVQVKVVASHVNPEDGPETLEGSFQVTIQGVNRPPVPGIAGNLGTLASPILSGGGVCANSSGTTEPDGDTLVRSWGLLSKTGGNWIGASITLIGSEGPEVCFGVPNMTAPIQQGIRLYVEDGLHRTTADAIIYMAPAPQTSTNRPPTITPVQNPVSALTNSSAVLSAFVDDPDGNALNFNVVLLQGSTTSVSFSFLPVYVSATRTRVDVTTNTGLVPATFTFRFTASESSTTERYQAAPVDLSLVVSNAPTGGGEGDYIEGPATGCGGGNVPPSITINPNVAVTKPVYTSGSSCTLTVTGYDISEKEGSGVVGGGTGGTLKGSTITWDQSELQALGVTAAIVNLPRTNQAYTDSTATFQVPVVTSARDVYFTVTATDVLDCYKTARFAITIQPAGQTNNTAPVAKLTYKIGSGGLLPAQNPPAEGTPVDLDGRTALEVTLDGSVSTDDGGTDNLSFNWVLNKNISSGGAGLTNVGSATTKLNVLAKTQGTVTVTLTVKDGGNLSSQASILFNITDPTKKPVAKVDVKCDNQNMIGPVEGGALVTLDGSGSTSADGSVGTGLSYRWSQLQGPLVSLGGVDQSVARFLAPVVDDDGTNLKFQLVVTDSTNVSSDPKVVNLEVNVPYTHFSQIGVGPLVGLEEFRTVLVLVNRTDAAASNVLVEFFGSDGQPMDVIINNQPWNNAPIQVPARSSRRFIFTGEQLQAGWARVKSNVQLTGLALFQVIGPDGAEVIREVGLYSSTPGTKFATFFDSGVENAVAIANPGDQIVTVRVRVVNDDQEDVSQVLELELEPRQHLARFLDGAFLNGLPSEFTGTLLIESEVPVTVTVLKTRDGVVFSTLPLAAVR